MRDERESFAATITSMIRYSLLGVSYFSALSACIYSVGDSESEKI